MCCDVQLIFKIVGIQVPLYPVQVATSMLFQIKGSSMFVSQFSVRYFPNFRISCFLARRHISVVVPKIHLLIREYHQSAITQFFFSFVSLNKQSQHLQNVCYFCLIIIQLILTRPFNMFLPFFFHRFLPFYIQIIVTSNLNFFKKCLALLF